MLVCWLALLVQGGIQAHSYLKLLQILPNFLLHILRLWILCLQLDGKGPQLFLQVTSSIKPAEGERYPRGLQLILILPISHPAYLPDFQNELTAEAAALHRPLPQLPQSREVYFL